MIPVITTSLLNTSELIAIEQPELHIHPAVQVGLGDLFAEQIKERDCLFLIETHSEHLLLRLLRRVRETPAARRPNGCVGHYNHMVRTQQNGATRYQGPTGSQADYLRQNWQNQSLWPGMTWHNDSHQT
jgi:predicted ATPase